MADATLRLKGYREFMRAAKKAEKETRDQVREELKKVAEPVRAQAVKEFSRYDENSASGFRVRVWGRGYGVYVEQSKRRRTGLRPDYGALQMKKALLPSLDANASNVERGMEKAVDKIADIFEGKHLHA